MSSSALTRSLELPSSTPLAKSFEQVNMMVGAPPAGPTAEKQGIVVAILGPEDEDAFAAADSGRYCRHRASAASLRRTLSADMSSKKWLAQSGFGYSSPMKKIASSEALSLNPVLDSCSSSEDEDEEDNCRSEFDIWTSIQEEKKQNNNNNNNNNNNDQVEIKKEFDFWSLIISQKAESSKPLPPPYIHPLVRRSASTLSEKSLQICTESLGCETGSDGFSASSYSSSSFSSEASDAESECCQKEEADQHEEKPREEEYRAVKFSYSSGRKSVARATSSFPPPLPSLSSRCSGDGVPTLRMRSRRDNGRLVVEAVSVPASQKNFAAERQDGRLVLKFANTSSDDDIANDIPSCEETEEFEEQFANSKEEESGSESEIEEDDGSDGDDEDEEEVDREVTDEKENGVTRPINFHRLVLMANKNRNNPATAWPIKYNKEEEGEEELEQVEWQPRAAAQSLPPRPRGPVGRLIPPPAEVKVSSTAAASFNHYEYFWRPKISTTSNDVKLSQTAASDKRHVLRGNRRENCLVPLLKGCCKEPRRTLLWEPRCIATS